MTNAEYIKKHLLDNDLIGATLGSCLGADKGIFADAWCVFDAWDGKKDNRTYEVNFLNWLNKKYDTETWKKVLDSEEYK